MPPLYPTTDKLEIAFEKAGVKHVVARFVVAADQAGDLDTECFFLTQAYVFALQTGDAGADELHRRLAVHGREE